MFFNEVTCEIKFDVEASGGSRKIRKVGDKCWRRVLQTRVVEECCREVLERGVGGESC